MTATGFILPASDYAGHPFVAHPSAQQARTLRDLSPTVGGTFTNNRPAAVRSIALSGSRAASFFDDYYNRFHLLPAHLRYGSVGGRVTMVAVLWSAWTVSRSIDSITQANVEGITLSGATAPVTMAPLSALTYDIQALPDGPATINGTISFHADNGQIVTLSLTGERTRLWTLPPSWKDGIDVTHSFKTDLITSRSGKEQRRALRFTPRKQIEFSVVMDATDLRTLNRMMSKWYGYPLQLADPTRKLVVSAVALDGSMTVVGPMPYWAVGGASVILDDGLGRLKQRYIDSVDGLHITFDDTADSPWPEGTTIRPTVVGMFPSNITITNKTNGAATANITLNVTPGSEEKVVSEPQREIHGGREVFPYRPNWAEAVSSDWSRTFEQVDFGRGLISTYHPATFSTRAHKSIVLATSTDMVQEIENFFRRRVGRLGEFYLPTFENDLPLAANINAGSDTITVSGTEVYEDYSDSTVERAVAIRLVDGRNIYRTVQTMYVSGENTGIQFTQAFFDYIPVSAVAYVSWMPVRRFSSDDLTVQWQSDSVAKIALNTTSLEDLTAENPIDDYDGAGQWLLESWGADSLEVFDRFDHLVNVRYPEITL
jgi:hypothetical protein